MTIPEALSKENRLESAIDEAAACSRKLLIEEFVSGREWRIGIRGDEALPTTEIVPRANFYDFNDKHSSLHPHSDGEAEDICPVNIDAGTTKGIQQLVLCCSEMIALSQVRQAHSGHAQIKTESTR